MVPSSENLEDLECLVKRLGSAYHKARTEDIGFKENTKAIFESICKSVINGEIYLPSEGLDKDLRFIDIKGDGEEFIAITKSLEVSMFTLHFRSPLIMSDGGRIYNACSKNENSSIKCFHDELLRLYFELFGRINTFNERIFEYFVGSEDKEPKLFRVKFNAKGENNLLDISGNSYCINIPSELGRFLAPDPILQLMLYPKMSIEQFGWYQFIKAQGLKKQLDRLVENQWHKILSEDSSIEKWENLLLFLDPPSSKTKLEWNPITKAHLKRALKFLQGISIYRFFASAEIVSILSVKNNRDIFGVTIGFSDDKINNDGFLKAFCNQIDGFGKNILPEIKENKSTNSVKNDFNPENVFGIESWTAIKEDKYVSENDKDLFLKCAEIIDMITGLAFASHEGDDIRFTLYFGRQPSLSRFSEICAFSPDDLKYLNSNFSNFLKSHYSLFQSNLNGLFVDILNESQIYLVKPLSILPSITDTKHISLFELDSMVGKQSDEDTLKSITDSDHHLLALQVGMNQMRIFYKDRIYLKWPGGDNLTWSKNQNGDWSDEFYLSLLIEKIISFSSITDKDEKKYVSCLVTKTVLKVSGEKGKGGMFVFGRSNKNDLLDGYKSKLNAQQINFWKKMKITQCDSDDLYNMVIPDGATLINLHSLVIENQIQIIPIKDGRAIDLSSFITNGNSQGTKHMTGKAISSALENKLLVLCVSADGPVTVYYRGNELLKESLCNIDLH